MPLSSSCSTPVITVAMVRPFLNHCLKLRALFNSACSHDASKAFGYAASSSWRRSASRASNAASAAILPDLMAAWLPLMRDAFRKPASQPTSTPPGNVSLGKDIRPPAVMARAP
ncbi:hypothetical protein D3C77_660160 [compost metagenome]